MEEMAAAVNTMNNSIITLSSPSSSSSHSAHSNNKEEEEEVITLPGFRFHPTDEELVGFYLRRKVDKKSFSIELIKQIDIYKYDPWDLSKVSSVGEKEWYFFCKRGRKYRNSIRPNRVTRSGFWKATGIDKPIYGNQCIIGLKKSLVYYRGRAGKGTKTDWMMHEFRLPSAPNNNKNLNSISSTPAAAQEAEVWTLCRIFKRIPSYKKYAVERKETLTSTKQQNQTHSSSKTSSSLKSDVSDDQHCMSFGDNSTGQQYDRKQEGQQVDGKNQVFFGHHHWNPSFWNPSISNNGNGEDLFVTRRYSSNSWDELSSVVELALDPPSRHSVPYLCDSCYTV